MHRLRAFVAGHRGWFVLLATCALAVRLIVPAGFMPVAGAGMQFCSGTMPAAAMPDMAHGGSDHHDGGKSEGRAEMPCGFAVAGLAALGAADPVLLLAALAFAFLLAVMAVAPVPSLSRVRLRPPLRAPPAAA